MANLATIPRKQLKETVVVFGDPKSGKTTAVAELATQHKLFWIDLENGASTLLKLSPEAQANVDLIQIPDSPENPIALETVLYLLKGLPTKLCLEHGKVNCPLCIKSGASFDEVQLTRDHILVVDSLTQLTASIESRITVGKATDYKFQFDDYAKLGKYLEMFLSVIQSGIYNVVCITHAAEVEFDGDKKKIVPIAGTSKFSRTTARYFRHAVYAEVKAAKHRLVSKSTAYPNIVTGSSTDIDTSIDNSLLSIFANAS